MIRDIIKIIIVFWNIYYCYGKRYDNYTLYRGVPVTKDHLRFLQNLSNIYDVNFWRTPSLVKKPVEFVVAPEHRDQFLVNVEKEGLYLTTIMENVQGAFDEQTAKAYIRRNMASFDWRNYFRIDDIYNWLNDLQQAHPEEMQLNEIGKTHEYRKIMSVRVYFKNGPAHRPTVIIEGGIHAREWIAPAFVTYFLNQIVTSSTSDNNELKLIAKHYEWIFVPVLNPDGYEYSHTDDRLWRKNRRDTGVDLNRNFGYQFGSVGISFEKTSEIYAGQTAFSEYESSALRDLVIKHKKHLDFYFAFHSYGQYMIIPYAHSKKHLDNFSEMKEIATKAAYEVRKVHGAQYVIGTAYDTVGYLVSGASPCWVKNTYKVPYVLTMELRDQGNYGFALPPNQILPTCQETTMGMISMLSPKPHHDKASWKYSNEASDTYSNIADSKHNNILDSVIIFFNMILFLIVWFD